MFDRTALLWAVGGALLGGLVLTAFLALGPLLLPGGPQAAASPDLTVIPYPSDTPTATPTATPSTTPEASPTATPPAAGSFQMGDLVQVQGTQGDGLRLRTAANLNAEIRLVALESEVFEVQDGPVEADGYMWWFLVNPYDSSMRGWGVANYLRAADDS